MKIAVEFTLTSVNVALIYLFLRYFIKKHRFSHWLHNSGLFIVVVILKFISNYLFAEQALVLPMISLIATAIIAIGFFRAKIKNIIISTILVFLIGVISETLVAFIFASIKGVPIEQMILYDIYRISLQAYSYLTFLFFIFLLKRLTNIHMEQMPKKLNVALCALPLISIVIVYTFAINVVSEMYEPSISEIISLLSIVTVNVLMFIIFDSFMKQNEKEQALILIKAQNDAHGQNIRHLISTQEQIKKVSHDFRHNIGLLRVLCEKEEYDDLLLNLQKLENRNHELLIIDTKNIMLDAALSFKKEEALKLDINFAMNLDVAPNLDYITMEYCVLLSNALENAIESCARVRGKRRFLELELTANLTAFMFSIKNTLDDTPEVDESGEFFISKKDDKFRHGIGLKSMKQTCTELGGELKYEFNEEYFVLWIYIPL